LHFNELLCFVQPINVDSKLFENNIKVARYTSVMPLELGVWRIDTKLQKLNAEASEALYQGLKVFLTRIFL
jgi:hypothetical protein